MELRSLTLKEVNCFRGLKAIGETKSPDRGEHSEIETTLLLVGERLGREELKDEVNDEVNREEEKRTELEEQLITSAIEQKQKNKNTLIHPQIPSLFV